VYYVNSFLFGVSMANGTSQFCAGKIGYGHSTVKTRINKLYIKTES